MDEVAPELFGEGVLIDNIVEATKVDGICYYLPRHFDIRGEMTDSKLLKEGQSFETRKEYYNYLAEQDPGYFKAITKRTLFTYFAQGIDEWIDWGTNAAHFDDGTFAELLEFCEKGSSQEEVDQYTSVPFSMNTSNFVLGDSIANNRVKDLAEAQAYLEKIASTQYGESFIQGAMVTFPLPSAVHEGYEIFAPHYFAVVDNENTQEAAGEFLRWHFLEDVTKDFLSSGWYGDQFSINRDETDRYLIRNIDGFVEIPEDADESERLVYTYENMNKGKAQYDRTWEIIRQGDHFQYFRNEVFDVMYEEAGRFFSGSITAEQAAEYVQNRISIYLAEQG